MTYDEIHARAKQLFDERSILQRGIRHSQERVRAIERELNDLEKERVEVVKVAEIEAK